MSGIGVNIQPTQVFTNTVLIARVVTLPSEPASNVIYDFQVNGFSKQKGSSNTFDLGVAGQGNKNDVVNVIAQTGDGRSSQNQVTIQNSKPIAQSTTGGSLGGQLISIPLKGTDLDGETLSFRIVAGARNGVATIRAIDGGYVLDYTGRDGYNGTENIQIVAADSQNASRPAIIIITVNSPAINHAPVAFSGSKTAIAGQVLTIVPSASDRDPQDNYLNRSVEIVQQPSKGRLQIGSDGGGRFPAYTVFLYDPLSYTRGTDFFRYVVRDYRGAVSNVATVAIAIVPRINRAPVAYNRDGVTSSARTATAINIPIFDSDDSNKTLVFKIVQAPTKGIVEAAFDPNGFPFFRYVSNPDASGADVIRFVAPDKQGKGLTSNVGTISIVISPVSGSNAIVAFNAAKNAGGAFQAAPSGGNS